MSGLSLKLLNLPDLVRGVTDAGKLQLQFMRTELKRGVNRVRKRIIKEQYSGPPGIRAKGLAKGKNVRAFVQGQTHAALSGFVGISRILRTHEEGATILPKRGGLLYLRERKGTGGERIIAAIPKVVIPARTHVRALVRAAGPEVMKKVAEAGARASEVALSRALRRSVARG